MKLLICLIPLLLLPSLSYAQDLDKQINKACLRHAISLVGNLKSEFGQIEQEQADKILIMATESCRAYLSREFSGNVSSNVNNAQQNTTEEEKGDAFTKRWFETAEKDGNERLKKKR